MPNVPEVVTNASGGEVGRAEDEIKERRMS